MCATKQKAKRLHRNFAIATQSFNFANVATQFLHLLAKLHFLVSPFVPSPFGPPQVNEKEFYGVLNTLRGLPISPTSVGRQAAMELMAVIVSRGLHVAFPEKCEAMRDLWDQALRSSWVVAKRSKNKPEHFYNIHRDSFALLGSANLTDFDLLMQCDDWAAHPGVLNRVTHNSSVGEAMFACSEAVIARGRFKFTVQQKVLEIRNKEYITHEQVQDAKVPRESSSNILNSIARPSSPRPGVLLSPNKM